MEGKTKIFISIFWGIVVILTAYILGQSYASRSKKLQRTLSVTGYAECSFMSDHARWTAEFSTFSENLKEASLKLRKNAETISKFLQDQGFKPNEIIFSAVKINREYEEKSDNEGHYFRKFIGYKLVQEVTINSDDIKKIEKAYTEISSLIENGIEISSYPPLYFYSKLNELKLKLIAEAAKNARERAQKICEQTGGKVAKPLDIRVGVFQITDKNRNEDYSWGGVYDLEAKEKNATITVKVDFEIK